MQLKHGELTGDAMPFVSVFVFRQKMGPPELARVMGDVPAVFERLAKARGQDFDASRVAINVVDGAPRNVLSPDAQARGFQGLDILMLVFARIDRAEDAEELREALESQFRDQWVTRARIFATDADHWKVAAWSEGPDDVAWNPRADLPLPPPDESS